MTLFRRFFLWLWSVGVVVLLHVVATNSLLPQPWSAVNTVMVFLVLFLLAEESGVVVWIAFAAHFFIELYTISPFGIVLFSGTMATLAAFWLYQYFFTNQSWYTAIALSALAVIMYRALYTVLLLIVHSLITLPMPPLRFLFTAYGWEMLLTTVVSGVIYLLLAWSWQRKTLILPREWRL